MNDPIRDKLWADIYAQEKAAQKFAGNPKHEADMAVRDYDDRIASRSEAPAPSAPDARQAASEEEGMPGILKAMKWAYDLFYVQGHSNSDEREAYLSNLEDDLWKLFGEMDDLSALVARLARALRKAAPSNDLAEKAVDYLRRKGLQGSPLRDATQPIGPQS